MSTGALNPRTVVTSAFVVNGLHDDAMPKVGAHRRTL
jgi:hypothetical protein